MDLPVMPPVKPMLAKSVRDVPEPAAFAGGLLYEPKWDGFRCIVFRDGDEVELGVAQREAAHPLLPRGRRGGARELPRALRASTARSSSPAARTLDFDALLQRIHPAESRVRPAGRRDAGRRSWPSTCSRSATTT